jgi:hypothetical protein
MTCYECEHSTLCRFHDEVKELTVIKASHYDATERVLMTDPVIQDMARELTEADYANDAFLSSWAFTRGALEEYRARGGEHSSHIGGPAAAIRRIIAKETA